MKITWKDWDTDFQSPLKFEEKVSKVRESLLDALYGSARCGLYHNSKTGRGVGLGQLPKGIAVAYDPDAELLAISPEHLPQVLKSHLESYRTELLDSNNVVVRQNFEDQFNRDYGP